MTSPRPSPPTLRLPHRASLLALAFALALAIAAALTAPAPAQQRPPRPAHQPDAVNPVWRSWEFTTRGDLVVYAVEGEAAYDEERRAYAGDRDGAKIVQVTRYKGGEQVERTLETIVPKNEPADDHFTEVYRRNGYSASFIARMNGDVPFPCLRLEHANHGLFIFSEDVPVGGLVDSTDYRTGRKLILRGFRRQQEPPPSSVAIERVFTDDPGIRVERVGDGSSRTQRRGPAEATVRTGEVILKEDADTVPAYFRTTGKPSNRLHEVFHTLVSHHLNPRSVATYAVTFEDQVDPTRNYSYTKSVGVVIQDGTTYYVERLYDAKGTTPDGLVFGTKVARVLDTDAHPLRPKTAYHEGTETQDVAGQRGRTIEKFVILDGPYVDREPTAAGGEMQEIMRHRHDIVITQEASPRLARWQQYDRWFYQETDAAGKIIDSKYEEAYTVTELRGERTIDERELAENLALVRTLVAGSGQ